VRGVEEPVDVLLQPEDRGFAVLRPVAADPLEDADAVVQRVGEDVDLRLVPVHELAVHPDLLRLLDHAPPPARI